MWTLKLKPTLWESLENTLRVEPVGFRGCCNNSDGHIRRVFQRIVLPEILMLHVNRTDWVGNTAVKVNTVSAIPKEMDFKTLQTLPCVESDAVISDNNLHLDMQPRSLPYELYGIINHQGTLFS